MALSAALHHSRGVGPVLHEAPRGPKTDRAVEEEVREVDDALEGQKRPPPGVRPAPLSEVAGPLGRLVAPACPSGGVPALVPVVMVQEAAHDDATVSYLLSQTLLAEQEAKEVEELEAKLADREHRLMTSIRELRGRYDLRDQFTRLETQVIGWAGIKWEVEKKKEKKRKRKKRRKKRTPRTSSSRSTPGRTRRRHWHWRVRHAGFAGSSAPRDVFPVTDDSPLLLGNMAGMDQKDSIFVVGMALAYAWLVLLVSLVPLCSLLSWSGPDAPHHGQYPPEGLLFSGLVLLVILHLTLCSFPVVRPLVLVGRPAGRSASWPVWTRRRLCVAVQCSWGKSRSVLDRALFLGRILRRLGYVRVACGALNVESQCSWGNSRSVLDRALFLGRILRRDG